MYNETWDLVGPASLFFDTGRTWIAVLGAPPRGNAFYILAHAYIAAYLNELSGADTSAVASVLAHAQELLDSYDQNMGAIVGDVRKDFIDTAEILDNYNNGYIGPGHCED